MLCLPRGHDGVLLPARAVQPEPAPHLHDITDPVCHDYGLNHLRPRHCLRARRCDIRMRSCVHLATFMFCQVNYTQDVGDICVLCVYCFWMYSYGYQPDAEYC